MNIVEKEKEKNSNILLVIAERDMFRQEAIRLNLLVKSLHVSMQELKREIKAKKFEIDSIVKKWQVSEENNKKIVIELNNSILLNKELQVKIEENAFNINKEFEEIGDKINEQSKRLFPTMPVIKREPSYSRLRENHEDYESEHQFPIIQQSSTRGFKGFNQTTSNAFNIKTNSNLNKTKNQFNSNSSRVISKDEFNEFKKVSYF